MTKSVFGGHVRSLLQAPMVGIFSPRINAIRQLTFHSGRKNDAGRGQMPRGGIVDREQCPTRIVAKQGEVLFILHWF